MSQEEKIKEIEKRIALIGVIDAPGAVLVGLGLYAKFEANGNAFHPLLNDMDIVHAMLGIGTAIMIWGLYRIVNLSNEKSRLRNERR